MSSILVGQGTSLVDALGVIKRANISSIDGSGDRILGAAAGKAAAGGGGGGGGPRKKAATTTTRRKRQRPQKGA